MTYVVRAPQIDLAALLTQPNPQIDLKLQPYEISTRNFLKAVSNYKNRSIAIIAERRNAQLAEKKRLTEKIQAVQVDTNQCKVREIELLADLEREQTEKKDAELSVAAFRRQLATLREQCASLDAEIEHYRALAANLRREKDKERATLNSHASTTTAQLQAFEQALAFVIEGMKNDQLLIRFSRVDKSDPDREFSFVLDVSGKAYKVLTSTPPLPTLPILVDELNQSRDVNMFIRRMRQSYQEAVQS